MFVLERLQGFPCCRQMVYALFSKEGVAYWCYWFKKSKLTLVRCHPPVKDYIRYLSRLFLTRNGPEDPAFGLTTRLFHLVDTSWPGRRRCWVRPQCSSPCLNICHQSWFREYPIHSMRKHTIAQNNEKRYVVN